MDTSGTRRPTSEQLLGLGHMKRPQTWVLLDDRPGHQTQALGLADRLGWAYERRSLRFNGLNRIPNGILGARAFTLDKAKSDSLAPPYPDLVITMGRRCVPIARWIRRASHQTTQLVHLGRKGLVAPSEFMLLISCAHFNLPPHPKRMAVTLPPTQVTVQRLAAARSEWSGLLSGAAGPHVMFLVGGETAHHFFTPSRAIDLLQRAESAARDLGGTLTVVTSRRTSAATIAAMRNAARQAVFHIWEPGEAKNPYLGYLAWADVLIVTGESESMLAEAAATAKPLYVVPLQPKPLTVKSKVKRWMTSVASGQGQLASICRGLFNTGWITPYRDLEKMHKVMYETHLARPFGIKLSLETPQQNNALEEVNERLHHLLDPKGTGS